MAAYPRRALDHHVGGCEAPHDSARGHTSGSRSARQWPTVDECRPHKDSAHRRTTAKKKRVSHATIKKTKGTLLIFQKKKHFRRGTLPVPTISSSCDHDIEVPQKWAQAYHEKLKMGKQGLSAFPLLPNKRKDMLGPVLNL